MDGRPADERAQPQANTRASAQSHPLAVSSVRELTVACVYIPHFPLRVEILRHPELDGLPLALTDLGGANRRRIMVCSPEATERGVQEGMLLREAVNACPHASILTSDPVHYANVFADLIRSLGALSPGVEAGTGEAGVMYIDLRGLERLYGGMEGIVAAVLAAIPPAFRPRVGLAADKFTARMAALRARPGGHHAVPATYAKAFLSSAPIEHLPVPIDMQRRLRRFGLYYLRDIAKLPVGKLQAQFGPHGRRAWELANGLDREPVRAAAHEERVVERLTMPSPSVQIESVMIGMEQLAQRVFSRKDVRGRGARQVRLQLLLEDQRSWERTFSLKGAIGEPEQLERILRFRLAGLILEGAVESIVLELIGLTDVYARQEQLFDDQGLKRRQRRSIGEASRQLKQRYGTTPLYRIGPLEPWSRIPERRWALFGWEG